MDFVQPLAAIVFVMALLGAALFLLKKRGAASFRVPGFSPAATRRLEVLERISLGPQHALHLIRADGQTLLIATAPGSCSLFSPAVSGEAKQ
jgi:flagellar biogenesis protein FliO